MDHKADRLALIGAPGSGKTTIAVEWAKLRERIDQHTSWRLSFASALRAEVLQALASVPASDVRAGWRQGTPSAAALNLLTDPATKARFRPLLQWWGTEYRRRDNPNYWVDAVEAQIERYESLGDHGLVRSIVVDDCRFPNEYEMLKRRGFTFVGLSAGDTVTKLTDEMAAHESEQHWSTWEPDYVLSFVSGPAKQAKRLITLLG